MLYIWLISLSLILSSLNVFIAKQYYEEKYSWRAQKESEI
jgi:hypothetical protein